MARRVILDAVPRLESPGTHEALPELMDEFARLEALQREVQSEFAQFNAADRLDRDEVHDRALR